MTTQTIAQFLRQKEEERQAAEPHYIVDSTDPENLIVEEVTAEAPRSPEDPGLSDFMRGVQDPQLGAEGAPIEPGQGFASPGTRKLGRGVAEGVEIGFDTAGTLSELGTRGSDFIGAEPTGLARLVQMSGGDFDATPNPEAFQGAPPVSELGNFRGYIDTLNEQNQQRPLLQQLVGGAIFDPLNVVPGLGLVDNALSGLGKTKLGFSAASNVADAPPSSLFRQTVEAPSSPLRFSETAQSPPQSLAGAAPEAVPPSQVADEPNFLVDATDPDNLVVEAADAVPESFKPRVIVPDEPAAYGKPQQDYTIRQPNGEIVRGTPISPNDPIIPDEVFHVTTNAPAVRASGHLRASGEGGLGGSKQDQMVSFTTSREIAEGISEDLKLAAEVVKLNAGEYKSAERVAAGQRIVERLREQMQREGWSDPEFERVAEFGHIYEDYTAREWFNQYLQARRINTGKRNPIFFGIDEGLKDVDPANVDIISVPKSSLNTGALVSNFDIGKNHLEEVRIYGDVPLGQQAAEAAPPPGALPEGGGGSRVRDFLGDERGSMSLGGPGDRVPPAGSSERGRFIREQVDIIDNLTPEQVLEEADGGTRSDLYRRLSSTGNRANTAAEAARMAAQTEQEIRDQVLRSAGIEDDLGQAGSMPEPFAAGSGGQADDAAYTVEQTGPDAWDVYPEFSDMPPPGGGPPTPPGGAPGGTPPGAAPEPPAPPPGRVRNALDNLRGGWNQFKRQWEDHIYAINDTEKLAVKDGVEVSARESPNVAARSAQNTSAKADTMLERGTFGKNWSKTVNGKEVPNFKGKGLKEVLEPVKGRQTWTAFSEYVKAKRHVELFARGIESGMDHPQALADIAELEAANPKFTEVAKDLYKYQDELLQYAREMGLISDELLGKFRENRFYVPFQRVMDEPARSGLGTRLASVRAPFNKLRGSEREIINPLESIVKNTYSIINAAERNAVALNLADLAKKSPRVREVFKKVRAPMELKARVTPEELGMSVEGMSEEMAQQVYDIYRPANHYKDGTIFVLRDGKKEFYEVDPELYRALIDMSPKESELLSSFLFYPFKLAAKTLRAGAVISPDFIARNPIRDQFAAMVYSKYGYIPFVDAFRGMAHILKKDKVYQLYKMSGSEHSMLVSMDRNYLGKTFEQLMGEKGFKEGVHYLNPLAALQKLSALSEQVTRMGEFANGIRAGATPEAAGFAARDLMDFQKMGTAAREYNKVASFFAATIRGNVKMVQAFKERPVKTTMMTLLGITMPSVVLYEINRGNPRYQELPAWQRDLFWIIIPPESIFGEESQIIRIPKPFELGVLFGSVPERILEKLHEGDDASIKKTLGQVYETGVPGLIPQGVLPMIEDAVNYSFFRDRPLESRATEDAPPEMRFDRGTSETAKFLSQQMADRLGPTKSPVDLDNYVQQWTASLGRYAVQGIDKLLEGTGIIDLPPEPEGTLEDVPVLRSFLVKDPYGSGSESVDRFYERSSNLRKVEIRLKDLQAKGDTKRYDEYVARHPEALMFWDPKAKGYFSRSARAFRSVEAKMTQARKAQRLVYDSREMSPKEKRERILESNKLISQLAKDALATWPVDRNGKTTPSATPGPWKMNSGDTPAPWRANSGPTPAPWKMPVGAGR